MGGFLTTSPAITVLRSPLGAFKLVSFAMITPRD
jgi:hypothetical protein